MIDLGPQLRPGETVAIVTGASGDGGRALILELTRQGTAVVVAYLHDEPAAQAIVDAVHADGGAALAARADLTDPIDVTRLFDEAIEVFGVVDVVIQASGQAPRALVAETARRIRGAGAVVDASAIEAAAAPGT